MQGLFPLPWTLATVYSRRQAIPLDECVVEGIVLEILAEVLPIQLVPGGGLDNVVLSCQSWKEALESPADEP